MLKNLKTISLTFILILSINSCGQDDNISEDHSQNNVLRKEMSASRTSNDAKAEFENLTTEEKIQIWQDKLDQVLKQNITAEQSTLILSIKNKIPNIANNDYSALLDDAISLAKIMPEDIFISIFSDLEDTNISEIDNTISSSEKLILDLKSFKEEMLVVENNLSETSRKYLLNCQYRWMSDDTITVDGGCNPTKTGCGFLFLQGCDH